MVSVKLPEGDTGGLTVAPSARAVPDSRLACSVRAPGAKQVGIFGIRVPHGAAEHARSQSDGLANQRGCLTTHQGVPGRSANRIAPHAAQEGRRTTKGPAGRRGIAPAPAGPS